MKKCFTVFLIALFALYPAVPAFAAGEGGGSGPHHGHGKDKPGVHGHGKVSGHRGHMHRHASHASQYMQQMANFGKLMDPLLRKDLNNSLNQLNQGSKVINDLVNKEGYDAGSATKEYEGYMQSFKLPDLSTLQTKDLEELEGRGVAKAAAEAYVAKNAGEAQLMGVLAENGYAPTESNLRMLQEAANDGAQTKEPSKDTLAPTASSDRVVVVMNALPSDNRLENLDAIAAEASLKHDAEKVQPTTNLTVALNTTAGQTDQTVSGTAGGEEIADKNLVTEPEAEAFLTKQLGSKAEAKAILARLKKDSKGNPTTFSKLFSAFQDRKLAEYLANRQMHALSAHDALARVMGDKPEAQQSEAPMALIIFLVTAAILSFFLFSTRKPRRENRETRRFVVREEEPRWARWLKREAIPHAPKSSRFKKSVEPRSKAS